MKLKDFRERTKDLPDDMDLIIQKDSEGNGFSPLAGADPNAVYVAENTWSGNAYDITWSADDVCMEEDEWEELCNKPRCLVLYPIS